ncbi:AraC family transcriptional regulator N-terminal domain-containing protein [Halarcobacter ebronensis]|uniref:AraC family transcriptional regulator N-terminal domain-containing protein n=1 Tax=Halarcobacter ebronensis TaxID=1462615 RepID=UPI0013E92EC9
MFKSFKKTDVLKTIYESIMFIILQGSKIVSIGDKFFHYDCGKYLISSTYLPITRKNNLCK